jgi:subtilisin family serine protease
MPSVEQAAQAQGGSAQSVPGQYVVALHAGVSPRDAAAAMTARYGLRILHVYEAAVPGFAAVVPESVLQALARDPGVAAIEQDQRAYALAQTLPTGVDRIDADLSASALAGDGIGCVDIDVAVIDTGIQPDHSDLNVLGGVNTLAADGEGGSWSDENGHGTHVAGIIGARDNDLGVVGVAPCARLWALKAAYRDGSCTLSDLIAAVDYVAANAHRFEVANISMGCGRSEILNQAVNRTVARGVTVIVAAGNERSVADQYSPASAADALTVAALADSDGQPGGRGPVTSFGADDTFATFSNFGPSVDVIAPGVDIHSTWIEGGYATNSGTSMAAPAVAGAAALYLTSHPGATPAVIRQALINQRSDDVSRIFIDRRRIPLVNVRYF